MPKHRFLDCQKVLFWSGISHSLCSSENYSAALLDNERSSPVTKKYGVKCKENFKLLEEWYRINPISILLRIYHMFHSAFYLHLEYLVFGSKTLFLYLAETRVPSLKGILGI